MKIRNYSERAFRKLQKIELSSSISHSECDLFLIQDKEYWKKHETLVKLFKQYNGEYFSNKLYTINTLIDNIDTLGVDELVLPSHLFAIDGEIRGYTMPYIEKNINLTVLLNSSTVSLKKKLIALKKIGYLLLKIMYLDGYEGSFYLGDIHEGNFIYDIEKGIYRAIDLDSAKIGNNNPSTSQYLTFNRNLEYLSSKYPVFSDNPIVNYYISNENTTILSYIYMILNTISGVKVHELSIEEYYSYLQYLKENGVSSELIDMFSLIYTNCQNKMAIEAIDGVPVNNSKILTYAAFKGNLTK